MKINKLLIALLAMATVFVGCDKNDDKKDDPAPGTYAITPNPAAVQVGKTVQLTLTPAATAEWSSSAPAIATVDANGLVTGVAVGQSVITAKVGDVSASVMVTVSADEPTVDPQPGDLHPSLQHSEYYIFQMDDITMAKLGSKVKADLRANDNGDGSGTHSFYIWEGTYNSGTTSGRNFYGEAEGWYAFQVGNVGWSGGGLNIHDVMKKDGDGNPTEEVEKEGAKDMNALAAIMANPADYVFHIAMKTTDQAVHALQLGGSAGSNFTVGIGGDFNDNGKIYTKVADLVRDGSWNEIEIPMSTFINGGVQYASNNTEGVNVLVFLSGGAAGTMLQFDACFIYKK